MDALDRRTFLDTSTRTGLAWMAGTSLLGAARRSQAEPGNEKDRRPKVGAFTKSFQDRSIPEVCRLFKDMGLDGLDLTVRPGGHIDPNKQNVAEELPKAHRAAQDAGLEILFLTTGITQPDDQAERLLAAAAEIGVKRIKLGYYRYRQFGTLARQMDEVHTQIGQVAKLASKHGVLPCVHIHSGAFIPSHGTMLYELLRDFSPDEVGAYVDPLHMTTEGGNDGWRQGLDLLAPWIALCSVKNFAWERTGRDKTGQMRWHTQTVPIADGVCPLPEFVATLKTIGFSGPYSLHSEYKGGHSFKDLDTDGCLRQTAEDFKFLRRLL